MTIQPSEIIVTKETDALAPVSQLTTEPTVSEDGTTKVYSKTLTFTVTVSAPAADAPVDDSPDRPTETIKMVYGVLDAGADAFDGGESLEPSDDRQISSVLSFEIRIGDGSTKSEPSAPSVSEIVVTKVTDSSTPLFMEDDTFDFQPQLTTEPTAALETGDGSSNTILLSERKYGSDGEYVLTGTQHGAEYGGSHCLYQDVVIPALETGPTLAIEEYWV